MSPLLLLCLLPALKLAQGENNFFNQLTAALDTDQNGEISAEEMKYALELYINYLNDEGSGSQEEDYYFSENPGAPAPNENLDARRIRRAPKSYLKIVDLPEAASES